MATDSLRPVSVIVLTWNGLEVTRRCLTSLIENSTHPLFKVVVVDNGSTDGTLEYLRGLPGIELIENGTNLGFSGGNNAGINRTDGDVVLLNNDTEIIQPDWLERVQRLAYSSDDIGIVGCRLVNGEGRLVHAGTYMPTPSYWGQEYPGDEMDIGQYARDREVEGVIAACVYIKRELIGKIGPLDTDYFSYYEDTDYCLKARRAGYRVFCCGRATVRHLENASTDLNRMDFSGTFRHSREVFMSKWKDYYEGRRTHRLTWRSYISGSDLYSRVSRRLLWELETAGVDLNLAFLEGAARAELDDFRVNDMKNREADRDRPQVVFGPAGDLARADGAYNIGYAFTPYSGFPEEWVTELNRMDEVWVTSGFQREAALASGVRKEVTVIPLGVDPDYLHPGIRSFPLQERFTFLAPVEWGPSAAIETLLRAFVDEFGAGEGVVLIVKAASPEPGALVEESVEAMNLPLDRAPVVFMVDYEIPAYQTGSLLRSADCLVLAGRAAEPGTWAVEALACGVPVIAPGWGSTGEILGRRGFLGVDFRMVDSPADGLLWAEPDYGHLRALLRKARREGVALRGGAVEGAPGVAGELGWDAIARRIIERLDGIQ